MVTRPITRVDFESVRQAHPVPRLVNSSLTSIVSVHGTLGHGGCIDAASIIVVDARIGFVLAHRGWQSAAAEYAAGQIGLEVEIQSVVGSLTKYLLHFIVCRLIADGPIVVSCPGYVDEVEADVVWLVCFVQGVKLC